MNDAPWLKYRPRLMRADTIGVPRLAILAHRTLCDHIWDIGRCPRNDAQTLQQETLIYPHEWAKVRGELAYLGWYESGPWLCHDGAIATLNEQTTDLFENQLRTMEATNKQRSERGLPPLPRPFTTADALTGILTIGVTEPVTHPVTEPVTGTDLEKEKEEDQRLKGLVSKPLREGGLGETKSAVPPPNGKRPWTPFRTPTPNERRILELCREVLGVHWPDASQFFGNRVMGSAQITADLGKVERVMFHTRQAAKEKQIKTDVKRFALNAYKRFAGNDPS